MAIISVEIMKIIDEKEKQKKNKGRKEQGGQKLSWHPNIKFTIEKTN